MWLQPRFFQYVAGLSISYVREQHMFSNCRDYELIHCLWIGSLLKYRKVLSWGHDTPDMDQNILCGNLWITIVYISITYRHRAHYYVTIMCVWQSNPTHDISCIPWNMDMSLCLVFRWLWILGRFLWPIHPYSSYISNRHWDNRHQWAYPQR